MKRIFFVVTNIVFIFFAEAATETIDGISWTYSGSRLEYWHSGSWSVNPGYWPVISSITEGPIVIPSKLGDYTIATLGIKSFYNCNKITDVTVPESVVEICESSFSGCSSLTNVVMPSVLSVGSSAFEGCSSIESIKIPNVTQIGNSAFFGCGRLSNIHIGTNLVSINFSYSPFSGCTNVTDATVPGWQCTIPFDSVTNLVISEGANCISNSAFSGCRKIERVVIPNSVTSIGSCAFERCTSLKSVVIPSSVTNVGWNAFQYCSAMTNAIVYGTGLYHHKVNGYSYGASPFNDCSNLVSVTTMDTCAYMFKNCNKMQEITLLDGMERIKESTFYLCNWLKQIAIPNSVTSIGSGAFSGCSALEKILISDNVKSIGSGAFSGCSSLIDIDGLPQCVCERSITNAFKSSYQAITNIVVASGVTRIAADCFKDCYALKRIVIPASVTAIYDNAFKDCSALEEIVFLGDAPDVGSGIFTGTPRSLKITVKEGSVGWKGGVSTELPEVWPVGDATARGITYYDESADVAALMPVITPANGSIFADECEVSISCAAEGVTIYYRTDGKTPKYTETYRYNGPFTITDTSTIVAVAVKDGFDPLKATATLTKRLLTLAGAAGAEDLQFSTGGSAEWMPIGDVTAPGGVSVKSGVIGDAESSWLEVSISGRGTLSFKRKVSCEDDPWAADWDHLAIVVDETEREDLRIDGETGWEEFRIDFEDNTAHTVRWVYQKDESDLEGEDCAWISAVVWSPADIALDVGDGKRVVVPTEWIDKYENIVTAAGGDKVAALQQMATNGRKVWECFMLGLDPTKAGDDFKITRFWMENGKPMFEFSHSVDGAGNSFVPRIKAKGKANLTDSWSDVSDGGNPSFRFFTVEVALP